MRHPVVAVAVIAAGLLAAPAAAQLKEDINPVVWRVNGEPVYAAEISMMMQTVASGARAAGATPDNEKLMQAATQRVIDQRLLAQEASRLAIRNNPERLQQMTEAMVQQAGGRAKLDEILAAGGSSFDQAVKALAERDLVMQLVDTQIAPMVKIKREDVQAYYEEHKEQFTGETRVRARHIVFSAIDGDPPARYREAQAKAEAARERALAGEDFAVLAQELSEGPSGPMGGDLGFFTSEQMEPPFAEAAFALEPGGVSEVVQTRYGFHVIKVEERRSAGVRPFDEVEGEIAQRLHQKKVGERIAGLLETLRESGTIEAVGGEGDS